MNNDKNKPDLLHPSADLLIDYVDGKVQGDTFVKVKQHVESCNFCQKAVLMLARDADGVSDRDVLKVKPDKIGSELMKKAEIISRFQMNKIVIVSAVAKSLLTDDLHFAIEPCLDVLFSDLHFEKQSDKEVKMAAFDSGQLNEDDIEIYKACETAGAFYEDVIGLLTTMDVSTAIEEVVVQIIPEVEPDKIKTIRQDIMEIISNAR